MSTDAAARPPLDPGPFDTGSLDPGAAEAVVARALELARVVDGHNDLAWECRTTRASSVVGLDGTDGSLATRTSLPLLVAGGVGAQFWSVFVEDTLPPAEAVVATLEQVDWVRRLVAAYPGALAAARSAADVRAATASGRIACLMGAEGAHSLADSPAVLRCLAALGVRYLTLTHAHATSWADSATDDPVHGGLTERGRAFVAELERLGMLVDLSHVSAETMRDALDVATAPVVFSHSSCRALAGHPRDVPDDVLARVAGNGGVVMLTFVPAFLTAERAAWAAGDRAGAPPPVTVADVADHVEHARDVAGPAHIGLGGDFDGTDEMPVGLERVDGYPALLAELARRGWTADALADLAGRNVLRVLEATDERFAASRDHAGSPTLVR